jgi:hypothetical protein
MVELRLERRPIWWTGLNNTLSRNPEPMVLLALALIQVHMWMTNHDIATPIVTFINEFFNGNLFELD